MDTIETQIEKLQKGIENPFVSQPMKEKMKEALKQLEMRNINVAVPAQKSETTVLDLENRLKILNLMVEKNPKVKPRIKIVEMMLKKAKDAEKTSLKTKKTSQKSGKVKVKDIEILWSEGDQSKFDKFPKKYKTWKAANEAIKPIALDTKEYDSYNKVKFIVTFEDGETYEGRLDVTYDRYDSPFKSDNVVGNHIKEFLNYELDGEHSQATEETKKEIEEWLDNYDLGVAELKRVNKVSAKELVVKMINLVKGKVDPDYAHKTKYITEKDVEKFMSYGVYDELIIAFYCGVEIAFDWQGDLDYGGVQGIFSYTDDYIQRSIDTALKNCRAGKFELGFKYPHFDWSEILKGTPEEQIIEGKEREIPSTKQKYVSVFKILKYPNIVVGGDIGVREDMGGGIAWEDKTNPNQNVLESSYIGMVSSNPKAILDVLKACAKQKSGGAKDIDVLVNGLGGIGYRALDINKIKYADGGETDGRMFNFLKDDLKELETAINNGDTEKTEQLFSYWNQHLPSLKTKTNDRIYNFLKDDFKELEEAVSKGDKEVVERFFSYWNQHLSSLKMADGGELKQYENKEFKLNDPVLINIGQTKGKGVGSFWVDAKVINIHPNRITVERKLPYGEEKVETDIQNKYLTSDYIVKEEDADKFAKGGETEKKYIVTDGKDFGIIISAKDVDEALRKGNREFWSPYPVQVKLTQVQPYEKGKHSFVRASGNTNFDKVQFHFSGDGAGKVTQYNTNIDVEPTESQKDFIGKSKIDFVKFYNKTKYTRFSEGGQTFKGYGVEIRRDKDSYWEQYDENLTKEEADRLADELKVSGKYHEVVSQVPLPFADGGETIPTYGSWVERYADGDYRVSVRGNGMDFRHTFNDVFKPSELDRAVRFAKKIAENNRVSYIGLDTTSYDFVKGQKMADGGEIKEYENKAFYLGEPVLINIGQQKGKGVGSFWVDAKVSNTHPNRITVERDAPYGGEKIEHDFPNKYLTSDYIVKEKDADKYAKGGQTDDKWMQEAEKEMEKDGTVGLFTKKAEKAGKTTVEFAKEVLNPKNKDKYDLKTRREAQFMKNANPELFAEGGEVREVKNRLVYQYPDNRQETIGFINNSTKDLNLSPFTSKDLQEKGEEWAKNNGFKVIRTYEDGGEVSYEEMEEWFYEHDNEWQNDMELDHEEEDTDLDVVQWSYSRYHPEVKFKSGGETPEAKFKVGDKVYYLPKLSGFDNSTPLEINSVYYKTEDDLSSMLNVDFEPTYMYHFKGTSLGAVEKDLSSTKPKFADGGEATYSLEKYFTDYNANVHGNPYGENGKIYYVIIEDDNNPSKTIKGKVWAEGEDELRNDISHYLSDSQYIEKISFQGKYEDGGEVDEEDYIDYLNEIGESYDYESDEWIIGGENRVDEYFGRYGEALRDHDPVGFNQGRRDYENQYEKGGETKKKNKRFGVFLSGNMIGEVAYAEDIHDLINNKMLKRWSNWETIKYKDDDGKTVVVTRYFMDDDGMTVQEVIDDYYLNATEFDLEDDIAVLDPKNRQVFGKPKEVKGWLLHEQGGELAAN